MASANAAEPWTVADAPYRAVVKAKSAPASPDAGWLITVPEFGQTMSGMADVVLTDAKGVQLPLAKVWRGEGQEVLLLAQTLAPGQDAFVYFGGNRARRSVPWSPKISLFMETRRLPAGAKLGDWRELEAAWKNAKEIDGAGFVPSIAHGGNPFGESTSFLTHYTGWLRTDDKKLTLFTQSSDASFVLVNDKFEFGWPGEHAANANAKSVPQKEVGTLAGATRIDYYHAAKSTQQPAMQLGWVRDGALHAIPESEWLHPGTTELARIEHAQGWPVPLVQVDVRSYIGWEGLWLYDTRCTLRGEIPAGWSVNWEWSDGASHSGNVCERALPGPEPFRVTVRIKSDKGQTSGLRRIAFGGAPPKQIVTSDDAGVRRYVELFDKEEAAKLAPATLKAGFQFLNEFGSDQQIGRWAAAWTAKNAVIDDPLWIAGQLARLRMLAQSDPKAALAEVRRFDSAVRKRWPREVGLAEIELLVFYLKDPSAVATINAVGFQNAANELGRLAKIRLGDLYRLLGRTKEAVDQYRSVQKTVEDETKGRKLAALDRANSITIADLIAQGYRREAEQKLTEWELEHPMGKYDSDFLLLRARTLFLFGRWGEALQEIESFRAMNPDSPYQIVADFHRARALWELGRKDEARKIWGDLAKQYPKHDLAAESARLSSQ